MAETDGMFMTVRIGSRMAKACTCSEILYHHFSAQIIEFPKSGDFFNVSYKINFSLEFFYFLIEI